MTRLFSILLLFWAIMPVFSQATYDLPSGPIAPGNTGPTWHLSPEEAVEMAISNNLMMEMARIGTDIQRRRSAYVWNQFIPSVTATGTMMREHWATTTQRSLVTIPIPGSMGSIPFEHAQLGSGLYMPNPGLFVSEIPPMTLPQWRVNGSLSAELILSFALIEGIRSVRLDYEAGILGLEKAKLQMEQGVRKMYNGILLMEANAALLNESYQNAQRQANMAEANFRAGLVPRLSYLQAQVAVENMRPTINDLNNSITAMKGNFALLLGLPYDAEIELEPVLIEDLAVPPYLAEFITRSAAMQKPDIMELQANIITLQSQQRALFMQHYTPFLRFGYSLSGTFNPMLDPFEESWFEKDNWNRGGNFTITLGMTFNNLFGFTREGQQRRDMEANLRIQNIRLAQMIRETELEIFSKLNSLENTRATMEAQQATVDLAALSYQLTEEAYRAGLQDFQSVQNAALALEQSRLQLLTLHFNLLNDLIDLEYAIGLPFGTLSFTGTNGSPGSR